MARRFAAALLVLVGILAPVGAQAEHPQDGRVYVTMDDGVEIAVYLEFPTEWDGSTQLPVILQYDGYEGAGGPSWYSCSARAGSGGLGPEPACGTQTAVFCAKPIL